MADLVGTCPKDFWEDWIAEGDAAGDPPTGQEWGWYTRHHLAASIKPGDRFYVVAHGKLRGWAPVTRLDDRSFVEHGFVICREANAIACTIPEVIPGFRGLRLRWWDRAIEEPFPNWKDRNAG